MEIVITSEEILENSNDSQLGGLVRKKYWDLVRLETDKTESRLGYVSDQGYDKCIICGRITQYHYTTPIDLRRGYVEGAGQSCDGSCKKQSV